MRGRVFAVGLIFMVGVGLVYGRIRNATIGKATARDHPIVSALNALGEIGSTDDSFRDVVEVCIVNKIDSVGTDGRNCKTSGEVLALIKEGSCEVVPLAKIRARVLLSENTFECRKTNAPFRMKFFRQSDATEVLDFD
jgi:hypothetical protein